MISRKINIDEQKLHIENINNNGFTIIRGYVLNKTVKELKLIADKLFSNSQINGKQKSPLGLQKIIKDDFVVNNAPCLSKEFLDLSTTGDHLKVLNYFLNDPYYNLIPKNHSNFILAQANLRAAKMALPFHVDVRMVTEGNKSWSYQGFLGLEAIDKNTGCLKVIPKSHYLSNMPDSKKNYMNAESLEIDKGDLILFSSKLHHATHETIKKNNPPWSFLLTYRSWWCKQQFDFCKMINSKIFRNLKPNQKLLLGACSQVPDSIYASPSARQGYEILN
jgi:hypothetical protein